MLRSVLLCRRAAHKATSACSARVSRHLQSAAEVDCGTADERDATKRHDARPQGAHPTSAVPTPIATAMALADQLEHPESSQLGRSLLSMRANWMPDAEGSGLTHEELMRAKQCLELLHQRVEHECREPAGAHQPTEEKRLMRRQKAVTRRLGRMLAALTRQESYKEVEGVAFLWDDMFPQYARNEKHWSIICQYYAVSLNHQKRYQEVIEKFFTNGAVSLEKDEQEDATPASHHHSLLTPSIVSALLVACGHVDDAADTAVRVLRIAQERGFHMSDGALFQLLDTLLRRDPVANFDAVVQICDVVVHELNGVVPVAVGAKLIQSAAERNQLHRAMPFYTHPRDAVTTAYTEHQLDLCLLALWDTRHVDEMLVVLRNVLASTKASRNLKERVCKSLLRKSVEERADDCHEQAMQATLGVLALMEQHRIHASNKPFPQLLMALIQDRHLHTVADFVAFFAKYPHVMKWNAFVICELVLVAVRLNEVELIDELVGHALDTGIPVKYVALESVVAYYYRTGKFDSVEKACAIIRALRKNKHIPLGVALTEIGMSCNLKLGRYEEAVVLFEDFAKLDGEKKRVLARRPMLQAAKTAYSKLSRYDEANAVRLLLQEHYPSFLVAESTWQEDGNGGDNSDSDEEEQEEELDEWEKAALLEEQWEPVGEQEEEEASREEEKPTPAASLL